MYTPTTEEVREAIAEWAWSRRMFRPELGQSDGREADRWLAAHDAEVRASVVPEEPSRPLNIEREAASGRFIEENLDDLRDMTTGQVAHEAFVSGAEWERDNTFTAAPEEAEWEYMRTINGYGVTPGTRMRRTKAVSAGPWLPVEQGGEW